MQSHELAFSDWLGGMKYKDIAAKYNVKENTVKSWYKRYKWKEKREQRTQESVQETVIIAPEIVELVPDNKKLRRRIEKDLRDQLFEKGVTQAHFMNLVDDYLALWDVKNLLIEDIQERGVLVPGARGEKKNDSIGELNKTNAQMLKILSELGLKTSEIKIEGEDDDY
ncbi:P27 family phage terminase small subunit [Lysinibacillus sphaericus]|uniref:P27 family phage terminase small subunit n=1 Tax=Lysinibacillus sphaericus TaxID=1421 RepID=UPI003F799079